MQNLCKLMMLMDFFTRQFLPIKTVLKYDLTLVFCTNYAIKLTKLDYHIKKLLKINLISPWLYRECKS